uniref:REJ domain-containing protein n=1 Tax=Caenorhabditis japonica TaxID=281687 RepID=A0A8R1DSQ8_CAEJA
MLKKLFFNIFVLIIFSEVCHCALLNQCYTSGTTCIRFEKGYFEFANTVQLTGDNVPTLKVNTSTSTRIVLSELLSHLVFNNSWTLAALVVNAGTRTNVQWKIAPDETSEHPIEIQDPAGYDSEFSNETVHCIDIQNYADDVKRVLVIPPSYRFFFSTIGTVSSCASNGLYLIPFVWDAQSRSRIRGMSYFSLSDCTDKCLVQPVPSLIVRFCPNMNNSDVKIRIDQVEDFTAVLSDDLLGINFQRVNKSLEFPIGIMDCTLFMENVELLGENPICLGDGENIAVKFGSNPKIGVAQELKTRLSMRSAFLKNAKNAVYPNFTVSHEKKVATCSNLTKYEFEWKLNGEGQMYDDGLKLPAYSYSVDDKVNITLVARYNHEKTYSSSTTKTIHYVSLPLLVSLDCVERQVGKDHDLLIRAFALDQNRKNSNLKYIWDCHINDSHKGSHPCNISELKSSKELLKIPSSKLIQNSTMNITATVSTGDQSGSASCQVTVGTSQIPSVSFFRLAEKKQNVFDFIRIQALVSSSLLTLNVTWEIVRDPQYGFFNITSFLPSPTTIIKNVPSKSNVFVSLTIPPSSAQIPAWPGLLSGKTFVVRLWATNEKGSSFADLHLQTNSPPTSGSIDVGISASSYPPRALEVPVTFSVGDGWYDDKDDLPLSYQFGYKIYYGDNTTYEYWGSRSTVKAQQFFLPSTSGNSSEECGERVGITALLSVCDRLYSCSMKESTIFGIEPPENASLALMGIISSLNTDVANANFMSAIAKINVLNIELCTENYDQSQTDKITLLLFQSLTDSSESEEFQEALRASHSLLPVVSSDILTELIHVLSFYRRLTLESVSSATRMKRSIVEETSTKVYEATESEANDMLKVYDILIGKDKPVVDVFFLNINDFLTGFCVQLDENSGRVMSGTGDGYTTIQTQSINVNQEGYTGNFKISDPLELSNVTFLSYFATSYASWSCGNSLTSTCRHICLGTAWISQSAMADNSYLSDDLFLDQTDLSINKSVSDLHQISLVDPISGNMLTPSNGQFLYSVDMLVNNYKPINYYNCYLYSRNAGWLPRQCLSSLYAKTVSGQSFITCNCSATGIIGVFLANGPTPDPLPDHNEILLNFYIDLDVTADDLVKIFAKISTLAEVDQKYEHLYLNSNKFETLRRFVKISNRGNKIIQATLRPPFRVGQKSNSLAVQSIQKAVGYEKILNVITVLNFTYSAVERGRRNEIDFENKQFSDLSGDNNARKVTFNFAKSYLTQLGADADEYALKWAQSIATTLQISIYRLKNYKVFFGVVYNVTVTLPFTDEAKPLTAEEISLMIQECSKYGEFNFELPEESVQVVAINNSDIAMLLVMHETNSLMLAMVIVLSIVLGLGTIFICGAVLVKLRTDKLIVEERRRANLNENPFHLPPPPEYPVNSSPFQVVDQYR